MTFFSAGEFSRTQANYELDTIKLSAVPSFLVKEEHKARTLLLSSLNATMGLEAILLQQGTTSVGAQAIKAAIKATLQPL